MLGLKNCEPQDEEDDAENQEDNGDNNGNKDWLVGGPEEIEFGSESWLWCLHDLFNSNNYK
jgi:hypothetical protein